MWGGRFLKKIYTPLQTTLLWRKVWSVSVFLELFFFFPFFPLASGSLNPESKMSMYISKYVFKIVFNVCLSVYLFVYMYEIYNSGTKKPICLKLWFSNSVELRKYNVLGAKFKEFELHHWTANNTIERRLQSRYTDFF